MVFTSTSSTNAPSSASFSLLEVVAAMALFTFCVTTVMGLIPAGITASRDAREIASRANLLQSLATELQLTPFTNVVSLEEPRLFSRDGEEIDPEDADRKEDIFYEVLYTVDSTIYSDDDTKYTGMRRVVFEVTNVRNFTYTNSTLVVNSGLVN